MRLYSQPNPPDATFDLERSFGPFLVLRNLSDGDWCLLDGRLRDPENESQPWLGYNAGPLFGIAQQLEAWTGQEQRQQIHRSVTRSIYEQFEEEVAQLAKQTEPIQATLRQSSAVNEVQLRNTVLTIEFHDSNFADQFYQRRFAVGLLFDFDSQKRIRIQTNLAYRERELKILEQQLAQLLDQAAKFKETEIAPPADLDSKYEFHRRLIQAKLSRAAGKTIATDATGFIEQQLASRPSLAHLKTVIVDAKNYGQYREQILAMQQLVYEPARQTPAAEFDLLFESQQPLGIVLLEGDRIVAMNFAGRLALFTDERGVSTDPYLDDPTAYYSMDLTVVPDYRGGLGRLMKCALSLLAIEKGVSAIHGRNRDRLARSMWAINLSLGSHELQHLKDDYPDEGPYRDCIYYRCPLEWKSDQCAKHQLDFNNLSARMASTINGPVPANY
jgi:hypothetical protein